MSGDYIVQPLDTNPDAIKAAMIADYQARMPDWEPELGSPELVLMEVIALRHAVRLDVATQVRDEIFRTEGERLEGLEPDAASNASGSATMVLTDALGHLIEAGRRLIAYDLDGSPVKFEIVADVTVAPGSTSTLTGEVLLLAVDPGTAANGLSGTLTLEDPLDFVAENGVTLIGSTAGGVDAESTPDFLDRLVRYKRLSSPKAIAPDDFLEQTFEVPGVGRVLVLPRYLGTAGAVGIVASAADGSVLPGPVKTAIAAKFAPEVEVLGITITVLDPTRTGVAVNFTATSYPDSSTAQVQADAIAAVRAYLGGTQWGLASTGGRPLWREELVVRFGEIYAVLNQVPGLDHVTDVKVNGTSNVNATITGPGALPTATVTGTVS